MNDFQKTAKERAYVMLAYVNGAEIELRVKGGDTWDSIDNPAWQWGDYDYRIKTVEKKKVKMWQFIVLIDGRYSLTDHFYTSDAGACNGMLNNARIVAPALWTEIEVEE